MDSSSSKALRQGLNLTGSGCDLLGVGHPAGDVAKVV